MSDRIRRIPAIAKQIVERLVAGDASGPGGRPSADRRKAASECRTCGPFRAARQRRMPRDCRHNRHPVPLPTASSSAETLRIADLVAQIVGNPAVGINVEEMLAQALRQKPGGDRKILVMQRARRRQYSRASASDGACSGIAYSGGRRSQPERRTDASRCWRWMTWSVSSTDVTLTQERSGTKDTWR